METQHLSVPEHEVGPDRCRRGARAAEKWTPGGQGGKENGRLAPEAAHFLGAPGHWKSAYPLIAAVRRCWCLLLGFGLARRGGSRRIDNVGGVAYDGANKEKWERDDCGRRSAAARVFAASSISKKH